MFQRTSLSCKLAPVQYREYEYRLLCFSITYQRDLLANGFVLIYLTDRIDHICHSFIREFLSSFGLVYKNSPEEIFILY